MLLVQMGSVAPTLRYTAVSISANQGTCPSIDPGMWDSNLMICAGDGIYKKFYRIHRYMQNQLIILASHNPCTGDSGAPLVLEITPSNYLAVGIVSHTSSCSSPAAFVRLSSYTSWMQSTGGPAATTTVEWTSSSTFDVTNTMETSTNDVSTAPSATTTTTSLQTCDLASAGQFPFVVSVVDGVTGRQLCAGFIYNANHFVTTSSCANASSWVFLLHNCNDGLIYVFHFNPEMLLLSPEL